MAKNTNDGGPAFPVHPGSNPDGGSAGMSLRDWFATHAPEPKESRIEMEMRFDKNRNPHNDSHKPKLRSTTEIIADLAFEYADAMLAAREAPNA